MFARNKILRFAILTEFRKHFVRKKNFGASALVVKCCVNRKH